MTIAVTNAGGFTNVNNSWGWTATAGRIIVGGMSFRNWNCYYTPAAGYGILSQRTNNPTGTANAYCVGRVAAGGEFRFQGSWCGGNNVGAAIEITGATLVDYLDAGPTVGTSSTATTASITPVRPCILIAFFASTQSGNFTPAGGWTEVSTNGPPQSESDWPRDSIAYQIIPAPVGSYVCTATGSTQWATTMIAVYSDQTTPLGQNVVII